MTTEIDLLLSRLSVRLSDPQSGHPVGSGVIYHAPHLKGKVYVITAAHTLFRDADRFSDPYDQILVDVYNPATNSYESLPHQVERSLVNPDIEKDMAVLLIEKENIECISGLLPELECLQTCQSITSFVIKGFPAATQGKELVVIEPTWKQAMTGTASFQLEMHEDYEEWALNGFSGSGAFLHLHSHVYLYGIFARYREEGKGRIIYCQYLSTINEILQKNFLPEIAFTFLSEHGLTRSFFKKQVSIAIKNLGPRFSEILNFRLQIAQLFHDLTKDNVFKRQLFRIMDKWLTAKSYSYYDYNSPHLKEIEEKYAEVRQHMIGFSQTIRWEADQPILINSLVAKIRTLNTGVEKRRHELYELQYGERGKESPEKRADPSYRPPLEKEIARVREISNNNNRFLDDLDTRNIQLSNYPTLVIQGEAGSGKSHLFGDIVTQRIKAGSPTLLLLGQLFKSTSNVWTQIIEELGLGCSKDELLASLNSIGEQTGTRTLLMIDALNEGVGKQLWPDILAGFIEEVSRYPFIALAVSVRSTYYKTMVSNIVRENANITFITHEGFKGNEYEALRLFCEHYELQQPNFPILAPEFANPLFLQLICEGVKITEEKLFPQGFQGVTNIFNYYLKSISRKLSDKREEYELKPKIIQQAIEEMAKTMLSGGKVNVLSLPATVCLFIAKFPEHKSLLNDLIHENVLIQSIRTRGEADKQEDVIYFAYERFGDFIMAHELLHPFTTSQQVRQAFGKDQHLGKVLENAFWGNNGLLEALAVILPEKFDLEIVEVFKWAFVGRHKNLIGNIDDFLNNYMLDSFKWRTTKSIDDSKITGWINGKHFKIHFHMFFNRMLELTTFKDHPFNSDRFTRNLIYEPMSERDARWQDYFRFYSSHDGNGNAFPLRRLIDWAWQPGISAKIDEETARLTGQTLAWVLLSTFRKLRDEATKAMINLLSEQPAALISILKTFKHIDDMYIAERLYAVAYGCALRTTTVGSLGVIAQYVYDTVFKDGSPAAHLLLRDYARNVVEYAGHKKAQVNVDTSLIRPPYGSTMPNEFPSDEDLKVYELDPESETFKRNHGRLNNYIKFSTMSWDFGRYIVESALRNFSPVNFTMEKEYKQFLKGLKESQRNQIKYIESLVRLKASSDFKSHRGVFKGGTAESIAKQTDDTLKSVPDLLNDILTPEQYSYFFQKLIPHFTAIARQNDWQQDFFDDQPIKRWIVKRVYELGYKAQLHASYDNSVESHSERSENKIERIGKKYQWIAFHEIMAMVADNYKIRNDDGMRRKYDYYKGPWQNYLRDIDPGSIARQKIEHDEYDDYSSEISGKWWWDNSYHYWDGQDTVWIANSQDLPDPAHILQRTDESGIDWFYLKTIISWREPKPIGQERYNVRHKELQYEFQGYLVKKKDKMASLKRMDVQDFKGRWMPESHSANLSLFNRENFWSPVSEYNGKETWTAFRDFRNKVMITTSEATGEMSDDKSGAHFRYDMPSQLIFEGMALQYSPYDGNFVDALGETIVVNTERNGVLIRKENFLRFLEDNALDIVWMLLGEKRIVGGDYSFNRFSTLAGVYYIDAKKIVGQVKFSANDY